MLRAAPLVLTETALRNILGCSILVFLKIVYMEVPNGKLEQQAPRTNQPIFWITQKLNQYGIEYWSARDLQLCLGYSQWRYFENALKKAITSCKKSGNDPQNHFAGVRKMVSIGSQTEREIEDWHLSRFACYLIAQNGDPRKPEIAEAQKYFAIQTRRQDLSDAMIADLERLELIKQASIEFKSSLKVAILNFVR